MDNMEIDKKEIQRLKRNEYMRSYYSKKKNQRLQVNEKIDILLSKINNDTSQNLEEKIKNLRTENIELKEEIKDLNMLIEKLKKYIQDNI